MKAYCIASACLFLVPAAVSCGIREYPHEREADPDRYLTAPGLVDASVMRPDAAVFDAAAMRDAAVPRDTSAYAKDAGGDTGKLVLNGVALAREDVVAFIHFGHSNMEGRARAPEEERAYHFTDTDPHAWVYHVGSMPALAREPYTACVSKAACDMPQAGPGTALLKQAVELAPNKYFVSLGSGHGFATCKQYSPGGLYFDEITQAAIALKDRVTFAAIVVMLGITEKDGDAPGFADCMTKLIAAVRSAVGQPDLPLLMSDYEVSAKGTWALGTEHANLLTGQINKLPSLIPRTILVPTDNLPMQDGHHFNLTGHKIWTKRLLDLMVTQGWFPWAEAAAVTK